MLKVGLTGGIGSGKSCVSDIFKRLGVPVIDTDIIAHKLVDDDPQILQEIVDTFGQDVLTLDGKLNRQKLAQIVFNVKENKHRLENILHPKIQAETLAQLKDLSSTAKPLDYVIVVIPLLIEAKYNKFIDQILVVTSDEQKRIERVKKRDNRSISEIQSIISQQINEQERLKEADEIIENNSNIKNIETQVMALHKKYIHLARSVK